MFKCYFFLFALYNNNNVYVYTHAHGVYSIRVYIYFSCSPSSYSRFSINNNNNNNYYSNSNVSQCSPTCVLMCNMALRWRITIFTINPKPTDDARRVQQKYRRSTRAHIPILYPYRTRGIPMTKLPSRIVRVRFDPMFTHVHRPHATAI